MSEVKFILFRYLNTTTYSVDNHLKLALKVLFCGQRPHLLTDGTMGLALRRYNDFLSCGIVCER